MAAQAEVTEWIELSDFTPGIHSGFHSSGGAQSAPDGAAQQTGTYACVGLPAGGLAPAPKLEFVRNITMDFPPVTTINPSGLNNVTGAHAPAGKRNFVILDCQNYPGVRLPMYVIEDNGGGPVMDPNGRIGRYDSGITDNIWVMFQGFFDFTGTGPHYYSQKAVYNDRLYSTNLGATPTMPWFGEVLFVDGYAVDPAMLNNFMQYGFGAFELGRASGPTNQTNPGQPHVKWSIGHWVDVTDESAEAGFPYNYRGVYIYPGDEFYLPYPIKEDVGSPFVLSHQGRTVWTDIGEFDGYIYGALDTAEGTQYLMDSDHHGSLQVPETLYWTLVNQRDEETTNTEGTVFVEENPTGYGAWATMNANELFLVKMSGGAVLVRGSLNNPTVTRLPGVEPTMGAVAKPVVTPLGCVYGSRTGVWAWSGSDTAQCLSNNLDGFFWQPPNTEDHHPAQPIGRFGYHYPYVFAPNNWIMDVRTGGWFRLADPDDVAYAFYNHSTQGRVYATPNTVPIDQSNTGAQVVPYLYSYKMDEQTNEYVWTSQPLARTKNRLLTFREINLVAQGTGTITITLTGINGDVAAKSFDIDSPNQPKSFDKSVKLQAHDVIVSVTSTATDDDDPAPTLYRLSLGIRTAQSVTATGNVE